MFVSVFSVVISGIRGLKAMASKAVQKDDHWSSPKAETIIKWNGYQTDIEEWKNQCVISLFVHQCYIQGC